ncbi:MAG: response regulator [Actinomycetota bacterium]
MRVLVVEADRVAAAAVAAVLRECGHEVTVEYDARGAVRSLVTHGPDVMFLDVALPAGDAGELLQRVRLVPSAAELAVAVVAPADECARWLADGAHVVLSGQVDRSVVCETVAEARAAADGAEPGHRTVALELLRELGDRA